MIDIVLFSDKLQDSGIEFITGVPDTLLNDFCLHIEKSWLKEKHVIAANEGNAIGLAAGYHLATGTIPLVYMQNSGIGNCVNPLLSLTHKFVYSIPMILLIGWRGEPGRNDHAQHKKQGEITPLLLESMDVPYKVVSDNTEDALDILTWAIEVAKSSNSPVALLATKGVFEKGEKDGFKGEDEQLLSREEAIDCVLNSIPENAIVVASTGRATRELYELRNMRKEKHNNDFLNVGAMGHTSSIALGIALATDCQVVCLEGDSSAIMHLGSFTTTGVMKPSNFLHIVLNNGVHESVGGQKSAGFDANLTEIAKHCGYCTIEKSIKTTEEINAAIKTLKMFDGPAFIEIIIRKGIREDMPPLKFSLIDSKNEFMIKNRII
ncbi:MAG TPA: phosphonopyruvate decarboxylase [Bacteroidia bacterium]|nr:phosphonopyruvate decarboxylase [Bacteroidia bacterium]